MLKEFTIKILLNISDSLIFVGVFLFCIFFILDFNDNFVFIFLGILIPLTFFTKILCWFLFKNINNISSKKLVVERFIATILAYISPLYILWNTPTLYINKEVSITIYILMLIFYIVGISIDRRFIVIEAVTK